MARILWGLMSRPYGWSLDAIGRELGVSERTLLRYVKACREELLDARGRPLVEIVRRGDRRLLRLADPARPPDSTTSQALSFYFAMTVLQFLDGTGLEGRVDDLWSRFRSGVPRGHQARLADLEHKFYAVPHAMHDRPAPDDRLDAVLRAVVNQRRLRIERAPAPGEEIAADDLDPYTLALATGTLYVIGRSRREGRIVRLPLAALGEVTPTTERFEYPKGYAPARHADGVFGLVDGEETEVSILVRSEEAVRHIRARRLHPTQRFIRQQGGAAILSMRVRDTDALRRWILSLGASVEVIGPRALRDDVRSVHAEAAALYGR